MNSIGVNTFISYLASNGIISSRDNTDSLISLSSLLNNTNSNSNSNTNASHKSLILSLAQLIKTKSAMSPQCIHPLLTYVLVFSVALYNQFISKDNMELIMTIKKVITLYQRCLRKRLIEYNGKWRLIALLKADMEKEYEHFDFMITKDTVHDRLYNHYKTKEESRRRLENDIYALEAENCTFIPSINRYYTSHCLSSNSKRSKSYRHMMADNNNNNNYSNTNINMINNENSNSNTTQPSQSQIGVIGYNNDINKGNVNNGHVNQLFYFSTNPNTSRITHNSLSNICITSSNRKCNNNSSKSSLSSKQLLSSSKRPSKSISSSAAGAGMLINLDSNTDNRSGKSYLTNQSSFNNLIIPNQQKYLINNSSSKSSSVNLLSNGPSTKAKTPKYSIGDFNSNNNIGGSTRESLGRLSKDLSSESLALLRYPQSHSKTQSKAQSKRNSNASNKHLSLKSYDNSSTNNIKDNKMITNYISYENRTKQFCIGENSGSNVKGKGNTTTTPVSDYKEYRNKMAGYTGNQRQSQGQGNIYSDFIISQMNAIGKPSNSNYNSNSNNKNKYGNPGEKEYTSNSNNHNYNCSNPIKGIQYNSVNNNNSFTIPMNIQRSLTNSDFTNNHMNDALLLNKNLKITSGIASEYLGMPRRDSNPNNNNNSNNQMNSIYTNQITLQTISDSKLYDIANHYITTDESLDKYSCLSNSNRKYHRKKY